MIQPIVLTLSKPNSKQRNFTVETTHTTNIAFSLLNTPTDINQRKIKKICRSKARDEERGNARSEIEVRIEMGNYQLETIRSLQLREVKLRGPET